MAPEKIIMPQAMQTALTHRLKAQPNALEPSSTSARGSKRAAARINYAEDYDINFDDDSIGDDDYMDGGRGGHSAYYGAGGNGGYPNLARMPGKAAPTDRKPIVFSEFEQLNNMALPEQNVPITIKLDQGGVSLRDMLIWNVNETLVTPQLFARAMGEDLDLPKAAENQIRDQIEEQLKGYQELLATPIPLLQQEKEFHVILDLSVNLAGQFYSDRIEWNLLDDKVTPEMFAETVVEDCGLSREFVNAIAFSIYDEVMKIRRELIETPSQIPQYADSLPFYNHVYQPPDTENFAMMELQGLRHELKKHGEEFSPKVESLTEWEIERRETEKERNLRRRKRETMKKVVTGPAYGKRRYDELEGTWRS